MKSATSLLFECIGGWLESNPYLIANFEIRKVNSDRFDVFNRKTHEVGMHIEYRDNMLRFWWLEYGDRPNHIYVNSSIIAGGYISNNCVSFETIDTNLIIDVRGKRVRPVWPKTREMDAANPEFFNWLKDWIRATIYSYLDRSNGLDTLR